MASKYANPDYWEERYRSSDTTFDWFLTFDNLQPLLKSLLQPVEQSRLMVAGCGNSRLSPCIYEQLHLKRITNVDVSPTVIAQMQRRCAELSEMQWVCADLLTTPAEKLVQQLCPEGFLFDFILDKGLVDGILGGANSFHNLYLFNKNISRLLKRGGRYIVVSYGGPQTRIDHFRRKKLSFEVEHKTVEKPMFSSSDASPTGSYHVYIMTKVAPRGEDGDDGGDSDDDDDFYDRFMTQNASGN